MSVEIQHAMAGDRRAMARLLSAIENGSVSIRDVLPEAASIETGTGQPWPSQAPQVSESPSSWMH